MFTIARYVVRNKVGAVAVVALGVFFLSNSGQEEEQQPSSPWSKQAEVTTVAAAEDEGGFISDIMAEADTLVADSGLDPREKAGDAVGRLDGAASAFGDANKK